MEALVIGAGVIGLAVGAELAARGVDVVVAEAAQHIGAGVSSRNSGVIHGGMYYAPGSERAHHCVKGRRMLYDYCASRSVETAKPGKLIVATTSSEVVKLEAIAANGAANGVEGLRLIEGREARALEPELACVAALVSPETGIVDTHALLLALKGDIEGAGGSMALSTRVLSMKRFQGKWHVTLAAIEEDAPHEVVAFDIVINAAGLGAQALADATDGLDKRLVPPLVLAKGTYFAFAGRGVFSHLIYPAPVDGGLGIHVTLDLGGQMRFGPDVEWVDRLDYDVDASRAGAFYAAIRRYYPGLGDNCLVPDYTGIRPKLSGPGQPGVDFIIQGPSSHGLDGLVQLFGIESPGLTSCLSIAQAVCDQLSLPKVGAQRS